MLRLEQHQRAGTGLTWHDADASCRPGRRSQLWSRVGSFDGMSKRCNVTCAWGTCELPSAPEAARVIAETRQLLRLYKLDYYIAAYIA